MFVCVRMFAGTVVSHDAAQARGLACAVLLDANDLPLRLGPTSAHVCAPENATDTPIESGVCTPHSVVLLVLCAMCCVVHASGFASSAIGAFPKHQGKLSKVHTYIQLYTYSGS